MPAEMSTIWSTNMSKSSLRLSVGVFILSFGFAACGTVPSSADDKAIGGPPATAPGARPAGDPKDALEKGVGWLVAQQNPDGGYGPYGDQAYLRLKNTSDVGLTSFALYALAKSPRGNRPADGPYIAKAVEFLLGRQQADGGFYDPKDPTLQNYKTCVTLMALNALDRVKYAAQIRKAQAFIKAQQFTEEDGYKPNENLGYGGIGYGSAQRPDLSNTQFGLEALHDSSLSGSDELWKKAVVFIARTQNAKTVDPVLKDLHIGTTQDGGFRYAPGETRGPTETAADGTKIFSSYGSMTYAALKSLLYANVDRNDPLVRDAFAWISNHFSVKENPGMATTANPKAGQQGLFYYYHTMAKALSAYGQPVIKDEKGIEHVWARELADQLIALQNPDGHWQNTSERWLEEVPVLATSFALVSLAECASQLESAKSPGAAPAAPGDAKGSK